MSSIPHGAYALRCRVCEDVTEPEPLETCRRCDGATDIAYDWDVVRSARHAQERSRRVHHRSGATKGCSRPAPPPACRRGGRPLERSDSLSELLGVELLLKLEGANPTRSYKDRIASLAVAAAQEHGFSTLCCSSTGNLGDAVAAAAAATGLEAMILAPATVGAGAVAARHPGARVFPIAGTYDDCRRLELELGALFPWGFVSGNLHPYASEGAKTISFEIAEQLGWELPDAVVCPAASGTLLSKLAQGFSELTRVGALARAGAETDRRAVGGLEPDRRRVCRTTVASRGVEAATDVPSLSVGNPSHGDLALGAARASGGAVHAVSETAIEAHTALLERDRRDRGRLRGGRGLRRARRGDPSRRGRAGIAGRARRHGLAAVRRDPPGIGPGEPLEPDVQQILAALGLGS